MEIDGYRRAVFWKGPRLLSGTMTQLINMIDDLSYGFTILSPKLNMIEREFSYTPQGTS